MKIAVIGAGSTYTPELIDGLIRRHARFPVDEVALMDIDERKLRIVGGLAARMAERACPGMRVRLTMDLDDALTGAAFVMGQIRVGKLPARALDERIPLAFGLIGQETTGIGGFFNGLRTVPVMLGIARRMEALCPDATLINFSNPSGMVAEAVLRYGHTKMMGLCNIPINEYAAVRLAVHDSEAKIESVGLNHFSWITSVTSHGEEKLPDLIERGFCGERPANLSKREFDAECLRAAGGLPNGYLGYFYQREEKLRHQQEAEKTRAEICMEIEEELLALYADTGLYEKPALLDRRGGHLYSEAAVSLAEAIYNDTGETHVVNVQNRGVMPYLAPDEVGEIACRITRDGAEPLPIAHTGTKHMIAMIQAVKAYERLAAEAAVTGDRATALAALMTHPMIGDFDRARACFDALLSAHRAYLPQFGGN